MSDCTGFIQPFDLECSMVNLFAGSMDTFILIALVAIVLIAAAFRLMKSTMLLILCVFTVIMGSYMGGIFFFIVFIVGIIAAYIIGGLIKR